MGRDIAGHRPLSWSVEPRADRDFRSDDNARWLEEGQTNSATFSKNNSTIGNRPNLKSSLRVREELPGTGLPVGLTALRRIGYIAEVIGEETQSVGPLVRGPALKEENDTSAERILDNQSCLGVSSLIHRRQAAVRRNCPKLQAYQGWRGRSGERTGSRMNRSPQFQPKRGIPHVWRSGNPERSSHRETRVVMSWT